MLSSGIRCFFFLQSESWGRGWRNSGVEVRALTRGFARKIIVKVEKEEKAGGVVFCSLSGFAFRILRNAAGFVSWQDYLLFCVDESGRNESDDDVHWMRRALYCVFLTIGAVCDV